MQDKISIVIYCISLTKLFNNVINKLGVKRKNTNNISYSHSFSCPLMATGTDGSL